MKRNIFVILCCGFVLICCLGANDCDSTRPSAVTEKVATELNNKLNTDMEYIFNPKVCLTVGNHSYIYINKYDDPGSKPEMILKLLESFEKAHPELLTITWRVERDQLAHGASAYIWGLWIDHKIREK